MMGRVRTTTTANPDALVSCTPTPQWWGSDVTPKHYLSQKTAFSGHSVQPASQAASTSPAEASKLAPKKETDASNQGSSAKAATVANRNIAIAVTVNSSFDGGNIEIVNGDDCTSHLGVQLKIVEDPYSDLESKRFSGWFYFHAAGAFSGTHSTFTILNGGAPETLNRFYTHLRQTKFLKENPSACSSALPQPWPLSDVMYSYDGISWHRCRNTISCEASGRLSWSLIPEADAVYFACFTPYSLQRHDALISWCDEAPKAHVFKMGESIEGRPLSAVRLGNGALKCWVLHRQHPGETMAEWFAEGLLEALIAPLPEKEDQVEQLLKTFTFFVVPNMCPDGSVRGHFRTNAAGSNLNREWADTLTPEGVYQAPTRQRSPEVYHTLKQIVKEGCDAFVDVHGDELIPYAFLSGMEGSPQWGSRLKGLQGLFTSSYVRANADMQAEIAYDPVAYDHDSPLLTHGSNMAISANQIANMFDCLSVTIEQPFKDIAATADGPNGWSHLRSKTLGADLLVSTCVRTGVSARRAI